MLFAQIVPESQGAARAPMALPGGMADRVSASKTRARRQWAARSTLMLVMTGMLLMFMVIWQRDRTVMDDTMRAAERSVGALQAHLDETGLLPASLPLAESHSFAYASYADRYYAQEIDRPVIIAYSPVHPLKLRSSGRNVIVYANRKVHAAWMTVNDFDEAYAAQQEDADRFEQQRRARVP